MTTEKMRHSLVAAIFILFWILGVSQVQGSSPLSNQEIEAVETLVQVGKYRFNFKVIEGSGLTILLEAGGGMDSGEWNRLAPELARKTGATIVSYDRSGFGKSDLPETPHDMREEVDWLWQGLQKLDLNKNLVLVGHSFGGWMIRMFASEHPEVVNGMVFIDPFTNEFVDLLGVEYLDNHPMAGKLPFDTSQPEKLTKIQRAMVRMVGDGLGPKLEIMRNTKLPTDIPVVVITSGRQFLPKTEEQEAWRKSHEQLTASIEGATLIVAEESDHMVPFRQPDLIIEAVMKVIQLPHLAGKYFGQKVPGMKAELFAPGLISLEGRYEFAPSFSPEGDELLFTAGIPEKPVCVYYTRIVDGGWTKPKPVSLSKGAKKEEMEAFFSWDGRHIFFAPYDDGLDVRIWKLDIHEDLWQNPQPLKGQIADESAFFPTCSLKGTLYYTNISQKKIYKALLEKDAVQESGETGLEFGGHGFIAPDESFMLVDADQEDSRGKMDIYVAFCKEDGGWSKPVNLGSEVNTEYFETCPTLSSDGKYLFFSRYNEPGEISNLYWIDSRVIEEARRTFISRPVKPEDDFPVFKGPYLGQESPGLTPEVFAPGVLNTKKMGAFCSVFSPAGDEFYFVYYERENETSGGLAWMKMNDNVWTKPEMLHFNSTVTDNDMCMSADGKKLIFRSWRALPGGNKPEERSCLWFVKRTEEGWSKAKPLLCGGDPVRTGYPSIAANGNLYFAQRYVEVCGIYRSKPVNGAYGTPEHVFTAVDSIVTEGDMFVAPDESYMIISCWDHPGNIGSGQGDLYVTFRKDDGTWTEGINMGELVNTQYGENCPQVSPDRKYFFFNRYNPDAKEGNIYWVDAKVIENLKPKELK